MTKKKTILIFLGAPGSGKGTQASRLADLLGTPHISTGDLFRDNIKNETELGAKAKAFMDEGKLVPDDLVLDMLFDRVAKSDCKEGYILDGFPRRLTQANAFQDRLTPEERIIAVNLKVSNEELVRRLTGRLTCRSCGKVFHKENTPPQIEGSCDACGGELYQRPDDSTEVVKERLDVYLDETEPVVNYYCRQGVLSTVDGSLPADEVTQEVVSLVKEAERLSM